MKIEVKRIFSCIYYTIGKLYIDGEYYCDTLEDCERKVKIQNETAINKGTYKVILNHSNRFNRIMPLLLNVPKFEGIRIHNGTSAANTSGCILVGRNTETGKLTESKETFENLLALMIDTKEEISIKIF